MMQQHKTPVLLVALQVVISISIAGLTSYPALASSTSLDRAKDGKDQFYNVFLSDDVRTQDVHKIGDAADIDTLLYGSSVARASIWQESAAAAQAEDARSVQSNTINTYLIIGILSVPILFALTYFRYFYNSFMEAEMQHSSLSSGR